MTILKKAAFAIGLMASAMAAPASATIYEYTMSNGSVLAINTDTSSATFTGNNINTSMTSSSFATFAGGAMPVFSFVLDSLDGTRLINGQWITDNPLYATTTHPQKLISYGNTQVNLWAWWGDPIIGGDYITYITSYRENSAAVPEPGALGLMALGLGGVAIARRRRRKTKAAALAA